MRFVGLDEGFEPGESVAFLDELGVTYEQFIDTDGAFAAELEIAELPSTVIVDADGSIVLQHTGALSYDDLVDRPRRPRLKLFCEATRTNSVQLAPQIATGAGQSLRRRARRTSRAATMRLWRSYVT